MSQGTDIAIRLLAAGFPREEVAASLDTDVDTIIAVQDTYAQRILDTAKAINKEATVNTNPLDSLTHDQKLAHAESMVVDKLIACIPMETNTMKVAKLLQTINGAKRRDSGEGVTSTGPVTVDNRQVVMLNVPAHMTSAPEYQVNNNNEVVAVNGKALAIASTKMVNQLAGLAEEATAAITSEANYVENQ